MPDEEHTLIDQIFGDEAEPVESDIFEEPEAEPTDAPPAPEVPAPVEPPPPSSEEVVKSEQAPVEPPPPSKPIVDTALVEENRRLRQEALDAEVRGLLGNLNMEAQARYDKAIAGGIPEASALEGAKDWLEAKQLRLYNEYKEVQNVDRDKELHAYKLSAETGVSVEELLQHATPEAMRAAATSRASENAEITALKARLEAIEKGERAPAQKLAGEGGAGSAPSSLEKKARDYGTSGGGMTSAEYNAWKEGR